MPLGWTMENAPFDGNEQAANLCAYIRRSGAFIISVEEVPLSFCSGMGSV